MKNIDSLQNVVVDKAKIADLVRETAPDDISRLIGVKSSQVSNLRLGKRGPSANGLLRLMLFYNKKPGDLATIE